MCSHNPNGTLRQSMRPGEGVGTAEMQGNGETGKAEVGSWQQATMNQENSFSDSGAHEKDPEGGEQCPTAP